MLRFENLASGTVRIKGKYFIVKYLKENHIKNGSITYNS